jgi:hypothetical protein
MKRVLNFTKKVIKAYLKMSAENYTYLGMSGTTYLKVFG